MHRLWSEPISPDSSYVFLAGSSWALASESIVLLIGADAKTYLQAWSWEGKKLWERDVTADDPGGISVATAVSKAGVCNEAVFFGTGAGCVKALALASGELISIYTTAAATEGSAAPIRLTTSLHTNHVVSLIAADTNGTIHVWDTASGDASVSGRQLTGVHDASVTYLSAQKTLTDSSVPLLNSAGFGSVGIWNPETGELINHLSIGKGFVYASVLIDDERVASAGKGGVIWIWSRKSGNLLITLEITPPPRVINALLLYTPSVDDPATTTTTSPILISTDTAGYLTLWSLQPYTALARIRMHDHAITARALIGSMLFTGGKDGGGPQNACGLDCRLRGVDLRELIKASGERNRSEQRLEEETLPGQEETSQVSDVRIEGAVVDVSLDAVDGHGEAVRKEFGEPVVSLAHVLAMRNRLAVCLFKRGRPHLEVWVVGGDGGDGGGGGGGGGGL